MNRKVLLSTDIGSDIDDALSLQTMLTSGIDLRAICTVNGDVLSRAFIAKQIVDLARGDIDILMGQSNPLGGDKKPYYHYEDCFVDSRFVNEKESKRDIVFVDPEKIDIKKKGLEYLAEILSREKHTVFCMAPLTDIAKLIQKYPKVISNIERLYFMGCGLDEERGGHNVRFDVPSAQIVLSSEIPIVVIPGDLCQKYQMPSYQIEQLRSPSGIYVAKMAKGFIGIKTAHTFAKERIAELIEQLAKMRIGPKSSSLNRKQIEIGFARKKRLITNLDDAIYAAFDPEKYFKQYQALITHLKNPDFNYSRGPAISSIMEMAIPKNLSVSDVYVPYCFLNPDKIKTKKVRISINQEGHSKIEKGDKHLFVTDLDFNDFRKFIRENLI